MASKYPIAPKHLSVSAKAWWKKILVECDGLDDSQLFVLQGTLEAYDRMKQAQAQIKKDGSLLVTDRFGQKKAHPLVTVERDCRAAIIAGYKALGLDLDNEIAA